MPKVSLDLTGKWDFREYPLSARRMRDLDTADWLETTVPSSIYTSLISADKIKLSDIYTNPEDFGWVSEKPWIYRKTFDAPEELLNCDRIDIVFEGLDTIANIWLNDKLLAKTNNMFISHRFDVTKYIKQKNNSLLVKFEPAIQYAEKLMSRYTSFTDPATAYPGRVYIRKAQFQFGWDFCPALVGCGIWRPVRLEGMKHARIENIQVRTIDCNHLYADIKIAVELETITKQNLICRLILSNNVQKIEHEMAFNSGEDFNTTVIRIEKPYLWWPAGYGQQNLYDLKIELLRDGRNNSSGEKLLDEKQRKVGIRTVKLNRYPDEPYEGKENISGEKFQFEINGQPIFAKGANWVPPSLLTGSATKDDYQNLLYSAKEANINILRVWGGGCYESDIFYQMCDELGIMVWQDFMFACAYYPDKQWFLKEVKTEAGKIIKQLRDHPSLIIWCGNNEINWLHERGVLGKGKKFYGKNIYQKILPRILSELDPDRPYIPTTPVSSANKDCNDPTCGTIHKWEVWTRHEPINKYLTDPIARFVTEFGTQSLPDVETIRKIYPAKPLRIGSRELEKHNYQPNGNSRLYRYIGDFFGPCETPERFIYISQITQARAVKIHIEHLRAHNHINSGVLFWQYNEPWPAITWSVIDNFKIPKALYYYAKRFYAGLLLTAVLEVNNAGKKAEATNIPSHVIAINDTNQTVTATIICQLMDLFGNVIDKISFPAVIGPFSSSGMFKLPTAISHPDEPQKRCLYLTMENDGIKLTENLYLYLPDKYIDWPEVHINKNLSSLSKGQWKLQLKSDVVAKDVQITSEAPVKFIDNFVDIVPGNEIIIAIESSKEVMLTEEHLNHRAINDNYSNA